MLETLSAAKKAVGAKQVARALKNGEARQVFLARDADPKITETLEIQCQDLAVPLVWVPSMYALGKACGIAVGSAVAAVIS